MNKIKIIFACIVFSLSFPFFGTQAADFSFSVGQQKVTVGQIFEVRVFVNTNGEQINAIEGDISYPPSILEAKDINEGNSIISLWVEKPAAKDGKIYFSGIIPGGYADDRVSVLTIPFLAKNEGVAEIRFNAIKTLLNDGLGTEASTTLSNISFTIGPAMGVATGTPALKKDIEPPEEFKAQIVNDASIFEGRWFVVFTTQDKGSGIDYYEVCEGKNVCVIADSPYVLKNQELNQEIVVRAVDNSGNERVSFLPARNPLPWYKDIPIPVIIVLLAIVGVALIIRRALWKIREPSKL